MTAAGTWGRSRGVLKAVLCLGAVLLSACSGGRPAAPSTSPYPVRVRVEVSDLCREALGPVREIEGRYPSGVLLSDADREGLNRALEAARSACGEDEYRRFQEFEFRPWLNASPGR